MDIPTSFLKHVGQAVAEVVDSDLLTESIVRTDAELAAAIWQPWSRECDEPARRQELTALVATASFLEETVAAVVTTVAGEQCPENQHAIRSYLLQVPSCVRQALRRPADPQGLTWPVDLSLKEAADLVPLLPARLPWSEAGDRPKGLGGWQLVELQAIDEQTETWKAENARAPGTPPTLFKFLSATIAQKLRDEGALLHRLLQLPDYPGIIPLLQSYFQASPPCLQYQYVEAVPLERLVREWHGAPEGPNPVVVARLVRQFAEIVGQAHHLTPPLIHRGLNAGTLLVLREANGEFRCWIAEFGVGELLNRDGGEIKGEPQGPAGLASGCASPQQQRGEPPNVRDDVFALGVIWYQLLTGNMRTGRPGGSHWRRRLIERGMTMPLVELLESCFEDDAAHRPADAAQLAAQLAAVLAAPLSEGLPAPTTPSEPGLRHRPRRGGVQQLFDVLQKEEQPLQKSLTNALGIKLVLIPAGTFWMGSPEHEADRRVNEEPRHEVTLSQPFYLAVHPVTQQQFEKLMGRNPARFHSKMGGSPEHPVESVSWQEAVEFCRRLGQMPAERAAQRVYRLPTEAEWEYTCRAGTTTPFCFGATLTATQANFDGNYPYGDGARGRSLKQTTRVGAYPPNNFGLCDMHGNVWEWCADWLGGDAYRHHARRNPQGPASGQYRVIRGGSWRNHAATCRAAYRNGLGPASRDSCTGFRVVLEVPATTR